MPRFRLRLLYAAGVVLLVAACSGRGFAGRQYEYEEQLYLNADGSAAAIVNASIPALIALRGLPLDPGPRERIDRGRVREMVSEPGLVVTRVSRPWRRKGRQFIQIRVEVDDVRKLGATKLFGWSAYSVRTVATADGDYREYRQVVGAPRGAAPPDAGWDGSELIAFKLHLPSRITWHNARVLETGETADVERGNILTWEQRLSDRLQAKPIDLQVSMDSGSILYRTLSIFALSFAAAVILLIVIIWMVIRRGRRRSSTLTPR
jgi:hypothetical protein